jgi:hypothetical protein
MYGSNKIAKHEHEIVFHQASGRRESGQNIDMFFDERHGPVVLEIVGEVCRRGGCNTAMQVKWEMA